MFTSVAESEAETGDDGDLCLAVPKASGGVGVAVSAEVAGLVTIRIGSGGGLL